ncbi:FAD-linked oxidoreductase aurO [Colletotrichum spinosum]|uniref:FAD-linked oxidoreductase aurO n=1 Tax=Colletotrichum spinosum TaxID=1347390 RepID=A0A4R8Q1Q3_9PEZI|nr:FAD-linked oxidoreductase aurO [Colletotrichum spinosum]
MGSVDTIESFLEKHSSIKTFDRSHPDFSSLKKTFVNTPAAPRFITRPQSASDVAELISLCRACSTPFVLRTGGHDFSSRSTIDRVLQIDLRDIDHVHVSPERNTARVGGGVLMGNLQAALEKEGFMTPTGTVGTVGYVGWATFGGYGPFIPSLGLGCDQILAAKVVLASGELVDADEELLHGLRGAGPALGAIVEVEIKIYPQTEIQAGIIVYDPSDLHATIKTLFRNWNALVVEKLLPEQLSVEPAIIEIPGMGLALAEAFVWNSPVCDESNEWLDAIAALGPGAVKMVGPTTPSAYLAQFSALCPTSTFRGSGYGVNLSDLSVSDEVAGMFAKHGPLLPGDGTLVCVHQLRGKAAHPEFPSVFRHRQDHSLLEIVGFTTTKEKSTEGKDWADGFKNELTGLEGVMEGGYYSLLPKGEVSMEVIYGEHWETVKGLKAKYDPENVFQFAFGK